MPAWTPAPYSLPYIAANDVLEQTPATNKAQMEKISEYLAQVAGMNPIGTVIPYAGDWGTDYVNLADPDVGAPFHLPCTGGVYANADFPLLSRVLGHMFVDGEPDAGEDGDYISGAALNKHHGSGYDNSAVYRRDGANGPAVLVLADAFCTPDFRGRSPIGVGGGTDVVGWWPEVGVRWGDRRVGQHGHEIHMHPGDGTRVSRDTHNGGAFGVASTLGTGSWTHPFFATSHGTDHGSQGQSMNYQPSLSLNFLIFSGQVVSNAPDGHKPKSTGLRDGSVHRLHEVTSRHLIRKRLADPNLSDEEREMLEEQLTSLS